MGTSSVATALDLEEGLVFLNGRLTESRTRAWSRRAAGSGLFTLTVDWHERGWAAYFRFRRRCAATTSISG
jgi:hypothetical protein